MDLVRRLALLLPLVLLLAAPASFGGVEFDGNAANFYSSSESYGVPVPSTVALFGTLDAGNFMFSASDSSADTDYYTIAMNAVNAPLLRLANAAAGAIASGENFNTSNSYTAGDWISAIGIVAASDDRAMVLNGDWANRGTGVIDYAAPANVDVVTLGKRLITADSPGAITGILSYVAHWSIGLGEGEIGSLAAGAWPPYVSSSNMVRFIICFNESKVINVVTSVVYTKNGAPVSAGVKNLCPWPGMQQ